MVDSGGPVLAAPLLLVLAFAGSRIATDMAEVGQPHTADAELDWDVLNRIHWPQNTQCSLEGCVGRASRWQFSHPALNCWVCLQCGVWSEPLSHQAQTLVNTAQQRLLQLSGGILRQMAGHPLTDTAVKDMDKGKGKGKAVAAAPASRKLCKPHKGKMFSK